MHGSRWCVQCTTTATSGAAGALLSGAIWALLLDQILYVSARIPPQAMHVRTWLHAHAVARSRSIRAGRVSERLKASPVYALFVLACERREMPVDPGRDDPARRVAAQLDSSRRGPGRNI